MASAMRRSARLSISTSCATSPSLPQASRKRRRLSPTEEHKVVQAEVSTTASQLPSTPAADAAVEEVLQTKNIRKKKFVEPDSEGFPRAKNEWKFGAHVSAAGGVENAVLRAAEIG